MKRREIQLLPHALPVLQTRQHVAGFSAGFRAGFFSGSRGCGRCGAGRSGARCATTPATGRPTSITAANNHVLIRIG
jgi:hypothetical protein